MELHYGIIGPGAVGTTIAYELLKSMPEKQVHLFGRREEEIAYYQRDTKESANLKTKLITHFEGTLDVLFIAVKTTQLDKVIEQMQPVINSETLIILAQNGYGALETINHPNAYQAVVYISGQKHGNEVVHYRDCILQIQKDDKTQALKEALKVSRLDIQLKINIEEDIWYKLLVNLGINSITAVSRQTASILHYPEMRHLCRNLLEEGKRIAEAENIALPDNIVDDIMKIYAGYPDDMGTSMYYDMIARKPLEVEAIQGYIYRVGQAHELYTPYLETVYSILSTFKDGTKGE